MKTLIKNVNIVQEFELIENGYILIEDDIIKTISSEAIDVKADTVIEYSEPVNVMPGFIDQHTHGGYDSDFMDASSEKFMSYAKNATKEGITAFAATTMTEAIPRIDKTLKELAAYSQKQKDDVSQLIAVHLEGPFINVNKKGAQDEKYISKPSIVAFDSLNESANNLIKLVTYAPENDKNYEFTEHLKSLGITRSIGHSDSNYDQVAEAINFGVNNSTHTYNAMNPLTHRDPGAIGAIMESPLVNSEIIVDRVHVHPSAIRALYSTKTAFNISIITDSMRAKGLGNVTSEIGGQPVTVKDGVAYLEGTTTLAGSVGTMDQCVKNMREITNCTLIELAWMSSTNPSKQLGVIDQMGTIDEGKKANLVILDEDLNVIKTIINGKIAFEGGRK